MPDTPGMDFMDLFIYLFISLYCSSTWWPAVELIRLEQTWWLVCVNMKSNWPQIKLTCSNEKKVLFVNHKNKISSRFNNVCPVQCMTCMFLMTCCQLSFWVKVKPAVVSYILIYKDMWFCSVEWTNMLCMCLLYISCGWRASSCPVNINISDCFPVTQCSLTVKVVKPLTIIDDLKWSAPFTNDHLLLYKQM